MDFLLFGLATTLHITISSLMKLIMKNCLNRLLYSVAFRSVEVLLKCSVNLYFHKLTQTEALFEYIDVFFTLRKYIL